MSIDGLRTFINKCPRNKEIFFAWLAKWAEKQINQSISGDVKMDGKLIVEFIDTK
jgi:hypothetical protein